MKLKLPLAHLLTRLNDTTDIHPFRPSYMQQLHILRSWSLSGIESTKKKSHLNSKLMKMAQRGNQIDILSPC